MTMKNLTRLTPLAVVLLAAGCSTDQMMLQNRVDYRTLSSNLSKSALEVPPDLTPVADNPAVDIPTRNIITAGEIAGTARKLLPSTEQARIERDGNQRWLVVQLPAEQVWPVARQFWQDNGFKLVTDNAAAGLIETDWQQNRAKLEQGFFASALGRRVTAAERDSYRMRIERREGASALFITHRGMSEGGLFEPSWVARPNDPELEAAMLSLLLQKFGLDQKQADKVNASSLPDQARRGQGLTLELADDFDRAWRRVTLAIERAGYEVVDRNRSEGNFIVRKAGLQMDKKAEEGFFSSLAFWRSANEKAAQAEFTVQLKSAGKTTLTVAPRQTGIEHGENALLDALLAQLR